jgi:uncharacterized protein YndB with AHSA1/START domain
MFRRAVCLPASTESVWRALTDPGAVSDWFGVRVEWDLRPGGRAHFHPGTGEGPRDGVIEDVEPGRVLRFRWWPTDADEDVSEVAYELRSDDEGTTLTVTERQLPAASEPDAQPSTVARAAIPASGGPGSWSGADQAQWELWAAGSGRTRQMVAVGLAR